MERLVNKIFAETISLYDILDGKSPDEVIVAIENLSNKFEGEQIVFDLEYDCDYELNMYRLIPESDEAYEKRIARVEKAKAKRLAASKINNYAKSRREAYKEDEEREFYKKFAKKYDKLSSESF